MIFKTLFPLTYRSKCCRLARFILLSPINKQLQLDQPGQIRYFISKNFKLNLMNNARFSTTSHTPVESFSDSESSSSDFTELHPDSSLNEFEQYLHTRTRTIEDILSIDVRSLPAIVRLKCLDAVLVRSGSGVVRPTLPAKPCAWVTDNWTYKYVDLSDVSRSADWNPAAPFPPENEPQWLRSEQFELLVLTTAASANQLSLANLLALAGHLQHLWRYYDPMVYAAVIRLVTVQVNEASLKSLFRLASLTSDFQRVDKELHPEHFASSPVVLDTTDPLHQLRQEVDLLRRSVVLHVLSRLSGVENYDMVDLMRFAEDVHAFLDEKEKLRLLEALVQNIQLALRKPNIHSIVFVLSRLSMLDWNCPHVIKKFFVYLNDAVHKSLHKTKSDRSQWIGSVLAALANCYVGSPHVVGHDSGLLSLHCCPPVMPNGVGLRSITTPTRFTGSDFSYCLKTPWAHITFTRLAGYLATSVVSTAPSSQLLLLEMAYSLSLFGYRAGNIMDAVHSGSYQLPSQAGECPPYPQLIELLVGSHTAESGTIDLQCVGWLPRVEWQFYYRLAAEITNDIPRSTSGSDDQLLDYKHLKAPAVNQLITQLCGRMRKTNPLQLHPFCRFKLAGEKHSYFADILFVINCTRRRGEVKLLMGFVCADRDFVVSRPLETLREVYSRQTSGIPITTFTLSALHNSPRKCEFLDTILRDVATQLASAPAFQSSALQIEPAEHSE